LPHHEEVCGRESLDCPHTGKDEALVLLSEYKKNAKFKTLSNNGTTAYNGDDQTAYRTAKNLTVLTETGSDYSTIPGRAV
jgi:hypothetical protein